MRLADRHVIAYEALARGPAGSSLETSDILFATARREGLETALDWECWRAALVRRCSRQLSDVPGRALFVNVEPSSAPSWSAGDRRPAARERAGALPAGGRGDRRALARPPPQSLDPLAPGPARHVARIALDQRQHRPRLAPPPIPLPPTQRDRAQPPNYLAQTAPFREITEVVHAVNAQAERDRRADPRRGDRDRGPLPAGIGARRLLRTGLALRPPRVSFFRRRRLPDRLDLPAAPALGDGSLPSHRTPFKMVNPKRPLRRADKRLLVELSRSLERRSPSRSPDTRWIISYLPGARPLHPRHRPPLRRAGCRRGAGRGPRGRHGAPEPAPGVRGVPSARRQSPSAASGTSPS